MALYANVLQPLIDVCDEILVFLHGLIGSWGLSIIGLTVVVRLVILPLTFKQVRSMQDLQRLQPEIKKIQERYKEDRQRMNQEMMRFYQEHKVNPLGSCLPILLQFPFFIALFYLLRKDLRQDICEQTAKPCGDIAGSHDVGFLFIPDLTDKAVGVVLVTLMVVYVVTQLVSGLVSTMTADKNQRRLILALPFVFVPFIATFPAGLLVYWITTNTWTIGQQFFVKRFLPPPQPIGPGGGGAGGAPAKPERRPSGGGDGARDGAEAKRPAKKAGATGPDGRGPRKAPPPSPRKKKKRTGRRR